MIDITDRLERLYTDNGTNYVQEAARDIRNLRAERDNMAGVIAQLLADNTALQNNTVRPLRERVRVLEDALQRYVNHDLLTGTRGKMNEIARAALGEP